MLPVLSERLGTNPLVHSFLRALKDSGFEGEIDQSAATRLSAATDNSVYQVLPDAVVFPRHVGDVERAARLLAESRFHELAAVPRGAGTGTNGQSLNHGVIVDLSRHQREILELNLEQGWVRVQPGVVLDDLNRELAPHGLFFAPTLSPSNRATLGGMVGTNASGKGSRIYGRTVDHVLSLEVVLLGGEHLTTAELPLAEAQLRAKRGDRIGRIYAACIAAATDHREEIERLWPKMPRTLTGYDLAQLVSPEGQVDLKHVLVGSEGTLGFVTEVKLRILPIPRHRKVVALSYAAFDDALAAAEVLVSSDPSAIETIDDQILSLARVDPIWDDVGELLGQDERVRAINLVEFVGHDAALVGAHVDALVAKLEAESGQPGAALSATVAPTPRDAAALWELRKKGVGLLGAMKGDRRPVAFVEDTAVPPARLAAYVKEFRALLDGAGLRYGMFGHVDVGCLHVRPALNLRDPADEGRLRWLSDRVVELVKKHGGVFWGEHGKGFRSEYVPEFFGEQLFGALCSVKEAFDPHGQLNPGKLAVVRRLGQQLVSVDGPKKGAFDRQIGPASQKHFDVAIHCNGNGQCFSTDVNSVMCPSSKIRRDRVHSPKGRATMLREWLRQSSLQGADLGAQLAERSYPAEAGLVEGINRLDQRRTPETYDFSHEVYDALDGCLSCKACATQCPIKVDVPRMKSEFLSLYHERYPRPLGDYFVAALEWILVFLAWVPQLFNATLGVPLVQRLLRTCVGMVDTPRLARRSLSSGLEQRSIRPFNLVELQQLAADGSSRIVLIVQDAFTRFYEPQVVLATCDVLQALGWQPVLVPYRPNGKALHIKGFLSAFQRVARSNAAYLSGLAALGFPMVGLEPAVTLTYREEYPEVLGPDCPPFRVELLQDFLLSCANQSARLESLRIKASEQRTAPNAFTLFGHCTEKTQAPAAQRAWVRVFEAFGLSLELGTVGCCGMCGVFGHEARHAEESRGIYAQSWQPKLAAAGAARDRILVAGHSCRSQVERIDGQRQRHPVELLAQIATSGLSARR